jgi:hypothetical protein
MLSRRQGRADLFADLALETVVIGELDRDSYAVSEFSFASLRDAHPSVGAQVLTQTRALRRTSGLGAATIARSLTDGRHAACRPGGGLHALARGARVNPDLAAVAAGRDDNGCAGRGAASLNTNHGHDIGKVRTKFAAGLAALHLVVAAIGRAETILLSGLGHRAGTAPHGLARFAGTVTANAVHAELAAARGILLTGVAVRQSCDRWCLHRHINPNIAADIGSAVAVVTVDDDLVGGACLGQSRKSFGARAGVIVDRHDVFVYLAGRAKANGHSADHNQSAKRSSHRAQTSQ